jgi:hypothetical protein
MDGQPEDQADDEANAHFPVQRQFLPGRCGLSHGAAFLEKMKSA